jgi:hypothetical protein
MDAWYLSAKRIMACMLLLTLGLAKARAGADLWIPFLYVADNDVGHEYLPGDGVRISADVENLGDETADGYTLEYYAGDYVIGSESGGALAPGDEDGFDTACSLPDDMPPGAYWIYAEVTCPNDDNSGNDEGSAGRLIHVIKPVPPDIDIESVDAREGLYRPGDSIVVTVSIKAVGGHLTGSCDIDFYASADRTISTDDYKIGNSAIGGLNPGDSYADDFTCHLPSDMPSGHYYIGIIATYPTDGGSATKDAYDNSPVYVGIPSDLVVEAVDANDGAYVAGDQIGVYSLIKNVGEDLSTSYTVDFYISMDTTITSSDYAIGYVNRDGLPAGQQDSYNTTCRLPSNLATGHYYIGIIVTCANDNDTSNNVGYDATPVELVHPPGFVCGQITYKSRDERDYPVRYAHVDIFAADNDDDPLDDPLIAQTHTDEYGNYGVTVPKSTQGASNIYVRVLTEGVGGACPGTTSSIGSVKDDVFKDVYRLQSGLYPHPGDSFVVIDISAPSSGGEFMVYDSIVEAFAKAKAFFGVDLAKIAVYWPSSDDGTYYDPSSGIFVARGDRGDRDVIMHEYGHYIADTYKFAQGPIGENPIHFWDLDLRQYPVQRRDEEARNLAFRESWASLFSIATQYGDTRYPYSGDAKYQDVDEDSNEVFAVDLERGDDKRCTPGEFYENMNSCALWDIFDEHNDGYPDLLSDTSLTKIWTVIRGFRPDNIRAFWDSWFQVYDYEREMKYIFRHHEMSFPVPTTQAPPANSAPVADAGDDQTVEQTEADGAEVTLSGSGYDPDDDPLTYEWSWDGAIGIGATLTVILPVGVTTATLTVSDGELSSYDSVEITVVPTDPSTWLSPH